MEPSLQTIVDAGCSNEVAMSEEALHIKTRREIMALGQQLGKTKIAAWACKEDENGNVLASSMAKSGAAEPSKTVIEAQAMAWEEAEKAKYMARFKREEVKIQAWENHQKAKTEVEIRKIEVKGTSPQRVNEKTGRGEAQKRGEESCCRRKRTEQDAKTEQQADHIRIPSWFSPFSWCS
ncbi:hypothetical protein MLD38_017588 [Melastoma candidum]|uniref:Uncharacterized protein n=1 Tax=Melastoma candidum TaxID=119954 RepID=A0ACB9QT08_9MYRT|nr:hypothetical protein MLD38_017588 [Melastoma candidum]